jgi:hypothetical protein
MPIFCGACGGDLGALPPEQPCPQCGSLKRKDAIEPGTGAAAIGGWHAVLTVTEYPIRLLGIAEELSPENPGIAIVVAHMACEIAVARALSRAFLSRGLTDLEESVLNFWNGYNLATERHRKLYVALTGDNVQAQPFWQGFCDSARLRNRIMHGGHIATPAEAERSLAAIKAFIGHVRSICT